ncbi:MMPL family transporter [Streptomyces sp. NY05-11A]|uniref:MMPL family transporter n=1 Tax=Streptomyces soliscabiei TaxID=588897 RepID=UPI0029A91DEB|nr:MMPL family transporter [Streptomyces sp. NY05-11A]MDX2679241.1 MMPL family transporter [Streptomyces sp. NY05-11A]
MPTAASPATNRAEPTASSPLASLSQGLVRRRRTALLCIAVVTLAAGLLGGSVEKHLSTGGYTSSSFESARADRVLAEKFKAGAPNLTLVARSRGEIADGAAATEGRKLVQRAAHSDGVIFARSYWNTGDDSLVSKDGHTAIILIRIAGDEDTVNHTAQDLVPRLTGRNGPLDVTATGMAQVNHEVEEQSAEDLTRAEMLAAPLAFVILLLAFGSVVASTLPVFVGLVSVLGTLAVLRLLTEFTTVSIFAMNITTALGFGLAVDYSLFLLSRYREERLRSPHPADAIAASLRSAGRTIIFSALTVMLSLCGLLLFPLYFLRSIAYAGIAVVGISALVTVLAMPPLLALLGPHIDRLDPFAKLRKQSNKRLWSRLALGVMRRPVAVGATVTVLLAALAIPFTEARFGLMDDRVLPRESPSQAAAETVRHSFPDAQISPLVIAMPTLDAATRGDELADYAERLSALPDTRSVETAVGSYAEGRRMAPPQSGFTRAGGTWLSLQSGIDPNSTEAERLVHAVRALPAPADALVGGDAATLVDTKEMLGDRIPWALTIIAVSMFALLFLFTGSVIIPLKQLILNMLSLTASFGAMVYVFQDGHLKWLVGDFIHTGQLEITVPILMFCVAFGLAMDYSVFLLSRIREEYLATGDNTRAVAFGMEQTGRLITAAALIVASVLGAMATSQLSILKLLGAGLALAVLVDAFLIRGLLVPSAMRLLGRVNWWAPGPMRQLHARIGLKEG